jgi:hypothetical protein
MPELTIQVVRFVDVTQPGWVECKFVDAAGHLHTLRDKVPIFTNEDLDATSQYPQPGVAACEVIEHWSDAEGRKLVRITTDRPYGIESVEGLTEFVVLRELLKTCL